MFYSLNGKLVHSDSESIAVECAGVAYYCQATLSTISDMGPIGSQVLVYTHLAVRDNAVDLYGFSTRSELNCFKMLISVTGIGPRIGIGILSALKPEDIALSIAAGDYKSLTAAPGVGNKTAQRMVLELKDKIETSDIVEGIAGTSAVAVGKGNINEAIGALIALGYSQTQAATALRGISSDMPVQDLIKAALKNLADD